MTKIPARLLASLLIVPATFGALNALAAPSSRAKTRLAALPKGARVAKKSAGKISTALLPRYVTMATIKKLQKQSSRPPGGALQPIWEGHALKTPMRDLLTGPTLALPPLLPTRSGAKAGVKTRGNAQRFPRPIAPASPARLRAARNAGVPNWVRYPLEFQLAGIGLGIRAVDKDRFNRIDRYGLFALHGNPTAVVRSIGSAAAGGGSGGGSGGASGSSGSSRGGSSSGGSDSGSSSSGSSAAAPTGANLTLPQTPPETALLFPQSQIGGGLPDWALAVTVKLDDNHVEWLYKRETYAMGFVVDRLGFVDAVIVAGLSSDISRTQLEDPLHTVKLGDDLRKVLFRYGYPDDIVPLAADPAATANDTTGAPGGGGGGGAAGGGAGAGAPTGSGRGGSSSSSSGSSGSSSSGSGSGGAAAGGDAGGTNSAFRTYDLRYEQSYNVVFTIRNNRVVRIYIFGDPDFFNAQRRNQIRTKY